MSIEVRNIAKRFNNIVAVDDVSFTVKEGSLTALLGPSGGGKSTVLRIIAGLETPDSGSVRIDGKDVTKVPARDRGIGFCFQHYAPFRHMTVAQNVAFGLKVRRRPKSEIAERVDDLLGLVRLSGFSGRYPSQLSGGQRQRMALARALAVEPKVLLLDEPFGALDAQVRKDLRRWLRDLHEKVAVTTVLVTHDQEEAMEIAEEIALIKDGHLEQIGSPSSCYDHPANEFVLTFLGPATQMDGSWVRPHDLVLSITPTPHSQAGVASRVTCLGFEVRVEVHLDDGQDTWIQATRHHFDALDLTVSDRVYIELANRLGPTTFAAVDDTTDEEHEFESAANVTH